MATIKNTPKHFYIVKDLKLELKLERRCLSFTIICDATDAPLIEGLGAGKGAGVIDHAVGDKTG